MYCAKFRVRVEFKNGDRIRTRVRMRIRVSANPLMMPKFGMTGMRRESGRSLGVYSLGFRVRGFWDFSISSQVRAPNKSFGFEILGVWVSGVDFGIWGRV